MNILKISTFLSILDLFKYFAHMLYPNRRPITYNLFSFIILISLAFVGSNYNLCYGQLQHRQPDKDYNPGTGRIMYDKIVTPYIIIDSIVIAGNKKTKDKIIRREVDFLPGDTLYPERIENDLLWVKNRIFNLFLFHYVDLTITGTDSLYKNLNVVVKERLNISILPEGGLADRNFNEWWVTRNHDLRRIYLGVNIKFKNVLGLNHIFKLRAYAGFNNKLESSYFIPYINKRQKTGILFHSLLEYSPQVAIQTTDHKLDYYEMGNRGREKLNVGFQFFRRNLFYANHQLGPYFQYTSINDTLAEINPNYFLNGDNTQYGIGVKYIYNLDKRDFNNYPLKGYYLHLESDYNHLISETKNKTNLISLKTEFTQFIPLGKRFYLATGVMGKLSSPGIQPYFNQRGLGYGREIISGYELYVLDGQSYGLLKTNFKAKLFSIQNSLDFIPHHHFKSIPFSMYFKIYADAGYVADQSNTFINPYLTNQYLAGGGAGFDIVTYLNLVGRVEYSINILGETGLYLHLKSGW